MGDLTVLNKIDNKEILNYIEENSSSVENDILIIHTQKLHIDNDYVDLYVLDENGKIKITDFGETFMRVKFRGINPKEIIDKLPEKIKKNGISISEDEIFSYVDNPNIYYIKNILHTIKEINKLIKKQE
ncbi:MAG: hypothetical protein KatS3mg002_1002 [Candidatus Woesearchaeota archaeon]|jgi:hypothetical protein|nr:MAG: hypothetical protein KatS3mg002_1002 [Candidatus Woesearchaeota archaeon]